MYYFCKKCNYYAGVFCPKCGQKNEPAQVECVCKNLVNINDNFCTDCGRKNETKKKEQYEI